MSWCGAPLRLWFAFYSHSTLIRSAGGRGRFGVPGRPTVVGGVKVTVTGVSIGEREFVYNGVKLYALAEALRE